MQVSSNVIVLIVQKGRNMEYTIDDINIYFSKNKIRINEAFNSCTEIPSFLKSQKKIKKIFIAGEWLGDILEKFNIEEEEKSDILFALGQRCFINDPYEIAIKYAYEYTSNKKIQDKPGEQLAEKITNEWIKDDNKTLNLT